MVNLTDLPPVCGRLSSCPTSPGSCAGVLQATGEKILSLKLLTNAKNYGEQVSRNTSLWVMSPLHPDPLVLLPPQEILDTLCLNDCSGSGQCSKGVCLCAAGRTGADCGVSVAEVTIPSQPLFDETKLSQFVLDTGPKSGKSGKPWTLRRPGSPLQVQWPELAEIITGLSLPQRTEGHLFCPIGQLTGLNA